MAVSIRLRREGTKNRPYYKVVVADSRSPRDGKFIEIIGTYDPKKKGDNSTLKLDRAEHWIARGAQPSDTVRSLLKKNKARAARRPAESAPASRAKQIPLPELPVSDAACSPDRSGTFARQRGRGAIERIAYSLQFRSPNRDATLRLDNALRPSLRSYACDNFSSSSFGNSSNSPMKSCSRKFRTAA